VDNRNNTINPMAAGICKQLHVGRFHPYPAGGCHCRSGDQRHSREEKNVVMEFTRTGLYLLIIALSIATIAIAFVCLAYALIKGSYSISNLIESVDKKVHEAIETLNKSIADMGMITSDISKNSNEIVDNLLQISQDAKTKVSEFNIPTPLRYEDFETGYQETKKFMGMNNGEANAPPNHISQSGYTLWKWQEGQRGLFKKRKLEHDKIAKLEEIGFDWTL
jgi:hypothetical protein